MPVKQAPNVDRAYGPPGGDNISDNDQILLEVVNDSGGTLQQGDVVVWQVDAGGLPTAPASGGREVTTTTTASSVRVAGVVSNGSAETTSSYTIADGAPGTIAVRGVARVNIGSGTVAADAQMSTSTTAKQAGATADPGTLGAALDLMGAVFAVALEAQTAKDANNTIRAKLI